MDALHIWATYLVILLTIAAYASERFSLEIVALASTALFLALFSFFPFSGAAGPVTPVELLSGFADPALATVLALLIVGQGLFATDAMSRPARIVARLAGGSPTRALLITLVAAMLLSAFLNNTPVVVIFIPVVTALAAQRGFSQRSAMMPLSFVTILGGMTTLMGSSTNLLAAGVAARHGVQIGFFDITIPGAMMAAVGVAYVFLVMPRILGAKAEAAEASASISGTPFIGEIRLGAGHAFIGAAARAGMFPTLGELTPRLVIRNEAVFYPPFEDVVLAEDDRIVVATTKRALIQAIAGGGAEATAPGGSRRGADYHLAEAVVAPGSRHAGRTIRNAGIETQHGVDMYGVQRKSRMGRSPLSQIRLEPGDTVLVGGTDREFQSMRDSHDLLLLEWSAEPVPQPRKTGIAVTIFAAIVLTASFDIIPIVTSSILGAFLMIALGCLTLPQASRAFDRQIFLLVGSSIAAATALERTGGAQLVADGAIALLEGQGPAVIASGLFLVVAVITNILSNNATAVLFTPIAIGMANSAGIAPSALVATVIFAANASFATPIGYQTNLLVMGPGRYSFSDFLRAGVPLVVIMWLTFTVIGTWYYDL